MKNLTNIFEEAWGRVYDIGTKLSEKYTQEVHWENRELEEELYRKNTWTE